MDETKGFYFMKFQFECKIKASDLWKLSMNHIYHSMVGVCNIIFTVAIILMSAKFWSETGILVRSLMVLGCMLFPVVHPMMIFLRSAKQTEEIPKDMVLGIGDDGLHVYGDGKEDYVPWSRVRGTMIERGMVIIVINAGRGYMLTDSVLGTQKQALLDFVETCVKKNKS